MQMSNREDIIEKYRRQLLEMHRKAAPVQEKQLEAEPEVIEEAVEKEEQKVEIDEETEKEEIEETENEQTDHEESVCSLCAGGIALCEFSVEDAISGKPIEYAQILISRSDGLFVRVLTDEGGRTDTIPLFADNPWRVSVTAQGYTSVSKARIEPVSGEKTVIPVRLDESLSIDGIFAEHDDSIIGA